MAEARVFSHRTADDESGERLDVVAAAAAELTRSRAGALIRDGLVRVNGAVQSKAGLKLRPGDLVELALPEAAPGPGPMFCPQRTWPPNSSAPRTNPPTPGWTRWAAWCAAFR